MIIEKYVIDYLKQADITGVGDQVYAETPESGTEYVLVEKTGSGEDDLIESATIAVQSYGPSKYRAAEINKAVKDALMHMADTEDVYSCRLVSDYDYTDTNKKKYRYQAVFSIHF